MFILRLKQVIFEQLKQFVPFMKFTDMNFNVIEHELATVLEGSYNNYSAYLNIHNWSIQLYIIHVNEECEIEVLLDKKI